MCNHPQLLLTLSCKVLNDFVFNFNSSQECFAPLRNKPMKEPALNQLRNSSMRYFTFVFNEKSSFQQNRTATPTEHLTHRFQNILWFLRDLPCRETLTCCMCTVRSYFVSEVFVLSAYKVTVKLFIPSILSTMNQCHCTVYTFVQILITEEKRIVNLQVTH